ncbi:putative xylan-binding protein with Ca-dependent carbohydrate-binding module [Kineococcus xinjiangensis]|uniref:Glucanase n=2 Tax=Kineococcus xinjiangensis TaxID=512762 RepID=A0A2S6IVC2_9ACTN|nr:putative xylan-binding protein with Ca-dependent carbohydrate-binding module [Kineococcus xinjiangensis]
MPRVLLVTALSTAFAVGAMLSPAAASAALERGTRRPAPVGPLEAETMSLQADAGRSFSDSAASAGAGLLLWGNGTAAGSYFLGGSVSHLVLRARGDQCAGSPTLQVSVDGREVGSATVTSTDWQDYSFPGSWPDGAHRVAVSFANDLRTSTCDRNLRVDVVSARHASLPAPAPAPVPVPEPVSGNPFAGARGYVDPASSARRAADARRSWDPAGAAALDKIASGPSATWFGDWIPASTLASQVSARVGTETSAGALPVLVAYAIPHRDCGLYSAGGVADAGAYREWIRQLAAGIAGRRAVVVLEPDALAQMQDCLSPADQQARMALLAEAVGILAASPATAVYLDAGGPGWIAADVMAARLRSAGVTQARGFSLNVSNFATDASTLAYGEDLSTRLGGKTFLVDTSRNGRGPGDTWCNPTGRGLGQRFTTATGSARADAFTWIKRPGESDGTCNGGPTAGTFWTDYAIGLGQRASF